MGLSVNSFAGHSAALFKEWGAVRHNNNNKEEGSAARNNNVHNNRERDSDGRGHDVHNRGRDSNVRNDDLRHKARWGSEAPNQGGLRFKALLAREWGGDVPADAVSGSEPHLLTDAQLALLCADCQDNLSDNTEPQPISDADLAAPAPSTEPAVQDDATGPNGAVGDIEPHIDPRDALGAEERAAIAAMRDASMRFAESMNALLRLTQAI